MKTLNYYLFFLLLFFLGSCQKDEITVTLKQSGKLFVELKDSTGKVYPDVKIYLKLSNYIDAAEMDSKKTDSKGKVDFGELQAGTYYIITDTIKSGNKYFLVSKPVQVISGSSKNLSLDPYDYTGKIIIDIDFNNTTTATIIPTDVKIALVKRTDYSPVANRQKVLSKAVDTKSLNASGTAIFTKIPANILYYAYIYLNDDDSTGYWITNLIGVSKDLTYTANFSVSANSLIIIRKNFEFTLTYYSYDYGSNMPVKNLNVVIVKYYDYIYENLYSADLTTILSYKVAGSITNSTGRAVLANLPVGDYYALGYYDETKKTWIESFSVVENGSNSRSVSIPGSYLGLN